MLRLPSRLAFELSFSFCAIENSALLVGYLAKPAHTQNANAINDLADLLGSVLREFFQKVHCDRTAIQSESHAIISRKQRLGSSWSENFEQAYVSALDL